MTPEPASAVSTSASDLTKPNPSSNTSLFETQAVAPAPGQTFYQALINNEKVILRDWPKLRYSQAISKVTLFPGEVSVPLNEFADSNIKDTILNVFGKEILEKMQSIVDQAIKDKSSTSS